MQHDTPVESPPMGEAMPKTPSTTEKTDGNSYTLIIDAPEKEEASSRLPLFRLLGIVTMVATFAGLLWYALQGSESMPSNSVRETIPADMTLKDYLAQQEAARPKFRTPPRSVLYPNVENLGRGYHVFQGDPRAPSTRADPGLSRNEPIFQIYNEDTPGVQILAGERCTTNFDSTMVYGLSSYRNVLENSVGVSAGVTGIGGMLGGSFSASTSWRDVQSATQSNRRVSVDSVAECSFYEASIMVPQPWSSASNAPLSRAFSDALTWLSQRNGGRPSTGDFESVIDNFGTHAIFNNMRMGSLVGSRREVSESSFLHFQQRSWDMGMAASLSMGVATFGTNIRRAQDREQSEEFEQRVERESTFTIGTTPRRQAWDSGGTRISPVAVAFDLMDLATVIRHYSDLGEGTVSLGMAAALQGYCNTLRRRGQRVVCTDPVPDNIPVPVPPTRWRLCVSSTHAEGGGGGSSFGQMRHPDWETAALSPISQIRLGVSGGLIHGNRINHVSFVARVNGNAWTSGTAGGGRIGATLDVAAGRRITRVSIRAGDEVDWLQFRYDNGSTRSFGGNGGSLTTFNFEASGRRNPRLIGFHGRHGARVNRLGFLYAYEVEASRSC